jgi:hypothetical protein
MIRLNGVAVPVELDEDALAAIAAALPDRGQPLWLAGAQTALPTDRSGNRTHAV